MKRTSEQVDPGEAAPVRWGPTLRAVRGYYDATTERSFLSGWSGEGMGLHFGLDGDGEGTHARSLERTNEAVVDALALTADDRCLDAGCGVGGTAIHVARRVGARVLGVTLSERQAELARGFAGEAGVGDRAAFVVADYGATGLAAGTFDAVWLLESFCHAESPGAVLRHLSGLLRPGGRLVCVDMLRGEGGDSDNLRDLCEGWVLPSLRSLAELEALATRAGLDAVRAVDLTPRVRRSAATLLPLASVQRVRLDFERRMVGVGDDAMDAHVRGALGCARGLLDGAVTYGMVSGVRAA